MDFALEVRNVFFQSEGRALLRDLSLSVRRGGFFLVLGASGSGKSLLLKVCAGLLPPDAGQVRIGGIDPAECSREALRKLRARTGFVFQNSALISNMVVYDNIALPLRYHRGDAEDEVRRRVVEVMGLMGVDEALSHLLPSRLSLEMRKRVALARALVLKPEILFLDQPGDGFGPEKTRMLWEVLRRVQRDWGAAILGVSSEWSFAGSAADRVGILEGGRISAEGTLEEMRAVLERSREPGLKEAPGQV